MLINTLKKLETKRMLFVYYHSFGGIYMKKFIWSNIYDDGELIPYAIIECDDETAKQIETLKKKEKRKQLWKFIADRLHELYPDEFPAWLDKDGNRHPFWYDNVLEEYDKAYGRLIREGIETVKKNLDYNFDYEFYSNIDYILNLDDEEAIVETAINMLDEELKSLPVYVI